MSNDGGKPQDGPNGNDKNLEKTGSQLRGRKLGDRRVRVERPQAEFFRYAAKDTLVARPKAHEEQRPTGRAMAVTRRLMFGRPLASEEEAGERLSKRKALAIFSSDAISSSAYATEEILKALLLAGVGVAALSLALPVSIGLALLLGVVALSYRMIVVAYPTGGGSYSVSKATFGRMPSLVAASALLIGYVLTVAVSVSSAADQIVSAVPSLEPYHAAIAVSSRAPDHGRQPARAARGRQHLRHPDLPLPGYGSADDRAWRLPDPGAGQWGRRIRRCAIRPWT